MVWPAGGAKVALIGTGFVTIEPSAGDGAEIDGAGGAGFHVMVVSFDISGNPFTRAEAWIRSTPALTLWYVKVASPVESADFWISWAFAPLIVSRIGRLAIAT